MKHLGIRSAMAGAVLLGVLVAAFVPISSAVALLSSPERWEVTVGSPATLEARGAAVTVPVTVTCPPGAFGATVTLSVTQRSGNSVVSGSRSRDLSCTGAPQDLRISVVATTGSRVFKKGAAFGDATLFGCGYVCGTMATDGRTVEIVR